MRVLLLIVWAGLRVSAQTSSEPPQNPPPTYAASSIVNAATPRVGQLAPGTLATLYGSHLALTTRAVTPDDIRSGALPTVLPGTGVRVAIGITQVPLLYVSPTQINFLVPAGIATGPSELRVWLEARAGSAVQIVIGEVSPALFQADPEFAVSASRGGVTTLYATGLGRTTPRLLNGELAKGPAPLERLDSFRVEIGGVELPPDAVLYAGAAPGFAGLYQINVRLPEGMQGDPEIRISVSGFKSPTGVKLQMSR